MRSTLTIMVGCVTVISCAGGAGTVGDDPTPTTVTATDAAAPTTESSTTTEPTTTTVSSEQLAKAEQVGDVAAGEELFNAAIGLTIGERACSDCHTLDGVDGRSPSLAGISAVAGERVEGLSDIEYLRESIFDPAAFEVGDWPAVMPREYSDVLSESEINDLIAFLLTR